MNNFVPFQMSGESISIGFVTDVEDVSDGAKKGISGNI